MAAETLAINGGTPMIESAELPWPIADEAIRAAVLLAIEDGSWGQYESRWTEQLTEKLGSFHSISETTYSTMLCSSGTIAVEPVSYTHLTLPTNREV